MRKLLIVAAAILVLAPAAAIAAGGSFTDDDSIFESNIEWLANAGVTAGCNPPDNDEFCPDDSVSLGQMAAFIQRFAQFLGAEDGVVSEADNATTAENATTADSATTAGDAATLNGMPSDAFVPHGEIILSQTTSELTPYNGAGPTTLDYINGGNVVSGDGDVIVNLTGPAMLGGVDYGLKSIEYCIQEVSGGALMDWVYINTNTPIGSPVSDNTDRTAAGCYVLTANLSGAQAYDLYFSFGGGGTLRLSGVQSTWPPAAGLAAAVKTTPAGDGPSRATD